MTPKFEETVVFVPFYGGRKEHLRRHADFVGELGYGTVLFENSFHPKFILKKIPRSKNGQWGLKHLWADEIEELLDSVQGPKIIFAFSNPSSCAIEAVARRERDDVRAMICDSGPFRYLNHCNSNRLLYDEGIDNPWKRLLMVNLHMRMWGPNAEQELNQDLAKLPKKFPILSIRPEKDQLVPPWAIDAAFRDQPNLDVKILTLREAGHLKGLRDYPDDYKPAVADFLKSHSRPYRS